MGRWYLTSLKNTVKITWLFKICLTIQAFTDFCWNVSPSHRNNSVTVWPFFGLLHHVESKDKERNIHVYLEHGKLTAQMGMISSFLWSCQLLFLSPWVLEHCDRACKLQNPMLQACNTSLKKTLQFHYQKGAQPRFRTTTAIKRTKLEHLNAQVSCWPW